MRLDGSADNSSPFLKWERGNLSSAPREAVIKMNWVSEWEQKWKSEGLAEADWPLDELPVVFESPHWEVVRAWRCTACENRPGLKRFYINVRDADGELLGDVEIEFDTEPGDSGTVYDHPNIYGRTGTRRGRRGYAEWNHFGVPTRYMFWIEGELLIERLRTDLGYEYCNQGRWPWDKWGYNAINRPGIFSFRIEVQRRE